jgi:hypothetical protein
MDPSLNLMNFPRVIFLISVVVLWAATNVGGYFARRFRPLSDTEREDLNVVLTSSLTLLGLIIGFTFSMAISRYDQRKNYEEAEANAIGTEYVRADLLPSASAEKVKELLKTYLQQRVAYYEESNDRKVPEIDRQTAQTQNQLWSAVQSVAVAQPTPVVALAVSGMNDVLNSQGYTQAAWWNRIPGAAWLLMSVIAIFSCTMMGHIAHQKKASLFLILPFLLSTAFFLIADIDSPRHGLITVVPQNLVSLSDSIK